MLVLSGDRFQFQNGAIKRNRHLSKEQLSQVFQFQNGAIKSLQKAFTRPMGRKFQFQNGAIKRANHLFIATRHICFNSKMVRLRVFKAIQRCLCFDMFQFQNGAIKS